MNVCTGGIRCEKATLFMIENGISDVVQLDGGILNYLESTNGNAWEGQCFLFDEESSQARNAKFNCELLRK